VNDRIVVEVVHAGVTAHDRVRVLIVPGRDAKGAPTMIELPKAPPTNGRRNARRAGTNVGNLYAAQHAE
jgi:hypothetical protein